VELLPVSRNFSGISCGAELMMSFNFILSVGQRYVLRFPLAVWGFETCLCLTSSFGEMVMVLRHGEGGVPMR
jgi:hypothetical protein